MLKKFNFTFSFHNRFRYIYKSFGDFPLGLFYKSFGTFPLGLFYEYLRESLPESTGDFIVYRSRCVCNILRGNRIYTV